MADYAFHKGMRSERAEFEKARRNMRKNPPFSMIGELIQPQQASQTDAVRRKNWGVIKSTGYDPIED